jgi:hypothetical protein
MTRHNFDSKILDYTWKQNRLQKDKEALKAQMLGILNVKPKRQQNETGAATA